MGQMSTCQRRWRRAGREAPSSSSRAAPVTGEEEAWEVVAAPEPSPLRNRFRAAVRKIRLLLFWRKPGQE
jgi:hypothetical protein